MHAVTIEKPFVLSIYPVPIKECTAFVRESAYVPISGCYRPALKRVSYHSETSWRSLGYPQTDLNPVAGGSWQDGTRKRCAHPELRRLPKSRRNARLRQLPVQRLRRQPSVQQGPSREQLRDVGILGRSVYPDIEGLSKSINLVTHWMANPRWNYTKIISVI